MKAFFWILGCCALLAVRPAQAQAPLTIQVGYSPLPAVTADAGGDTTICWYQSYTLPGSGAGGLGTLTYSWSPSTGLDNPNIANPTASNLSGTVTYTLTTTDSRGCSATDQMTLEVVTCASLAENDRFRWQVFPNPAQDLLQLRWDEQYQAEWISLKDLQGREITRLVPVEAGQASLPTATLPRGLYLLEISLNQTLLTQKIVLQ